MKAVVALVAMTLLATPSQAGTYNGNELFELCTGNREFMYGYVAGFLDKTVADTLTVATTQMPAGTLTTQNAANAYSAMLKDTTNKIAGFCFPEGGTLAQAKDLFCKYLSENPERRHLKGAYLLAVSLRTAWPCEK